MKRIICALLTLAIVVAFSSTVVGEESIILIGDDDVTVGDNQVTIAVVLPASAVGVRINRAVLEVPITLSESAEAAFNDFPLLELAELGSETPKQTILLKAGFDGVARFDITRFAREWSDTDAHELVLGVLSESNETSFDVGTAATWDSGIRARIVLSFSSLDGASATSIGAE